MKKLPFISVLIIGALLIFFKFFTTAQNYGLISFSFDAQRHLFAIHEINHLENTYQFPIQNYVEYPPEAFILSATYYPTGGYLFFVILHKITNFDLTHLVSSFHIFIGLFLFFLVFSITKHLFHNKSIALISALLAALGTTIIYPTPHFIATYLIVPSLVFFSILYFHSKQNFRFLIPILIFWLNLNILHNNLSFFVLGLFTLWFWIKMFKTQRGDKLLLKIFWANSCFLIAYLFNFLFYLHLNKLPFARGILNATGLWSVGLQKNIIVVIIWCLIILAFFLTSLIAWLRFHSKAQNLQNESKTNLPLPNYLSSIYKNRWGLFIAILCLLAFIPGFLQIFLINNSTLKSLTYFPCLLLIIVVILELKTILKNKRLFFLSIFCLPALFVFIFGITLGHFSSFLSQKILGPINIILDTAFPFLTILAAFIFFNILKINLKHKFLKIFSLIIIIVFLVLISFKVSFHTYDKNPHYGFIEAYYWLKPHITAETQIGSNFEYLRSFRYVQPNLIVDGFEEDQLTKINLANFMRQNNIDYFIMHPWTSTIPFPEDKWAFDIKKDTNINKIYEKNKVIIYRRSK